MQVKVVVRELPQEVVYMVFDDKLFLNETLSSAKKAHIINQILNAGSEHNCAREVQRR